MLVALHPTEPWFRYGGCALQFGGIGTVAVGIWQTRKSFGHPDLFSKLAHWISQFPRFSPPPVIAHGAAVLEGASASGRAYVSHAIDQSAPLEARIAMLDKKVDDVMQMVVAAQQKADRRFASHMEEIKAEGRRRAEDDRLMHSKLESVQTGGLNVSVMGTVWLSIGLFMGSLSPELEHLFRRAHNSLSAPVVRLGVSEHTGIESFFYR